MKDFRCKNCRKLLGKYRECGELEIKCPRCGLTNMLKRKEISEFDLISNSQQLESMAK
ncbi:MAG: Com family DNA-binding transcriptional regulator [Syntrophomonas sp.]